MLSQSNRIHQALERVTWLEAKALFPNLVPHVLRCNTIPFDAFFGLDDTGRLIAIDDYSGLAWRYHEEINNWSQTTCFKLLLDTDW